MTLYWKKNEEIKSPIIKSLGQIWEGIENDRGDIDKIPFGQLRAYLEPRHIVIKKEKWCIFKNPQSFVGKERDLIVLSKKEGYKIIKELILKLKSQGIISFTNKDISKYLGIFNLTKGDLINEICSYLTCEGLLEKKRREFKKDGDSRIKYEYFFNKEIIPCGFLQIIKGKKIKQICKNDWDNSETTSIFGRER